MRHGKGARKEVDIWRVKAGQVDVDAETWNCLMRHARIFET